MLNVDIFKKNYEKAGRTFADLMPFMIMPTSNLVLNKDGSLMASYFIDGLDYEGLEQYRIDSTSYLTEQAFRVFDDRITVWMHVDRRRTTQYSDGGNYEDDISAFVNDQWKQQFTSEGAAQYVNKCYVSVMFAPAVGVDSLFDKVNLHQQDGHGTMKAFFLAIRDSLSKEHGFSLSQADIDRNILIFEEMLRAFEETMESIGIYRLADEDLLQYLHDRCSPATQGNPVKKPNMPCYLDAWLPDNTLQVHDRSLQFQADSDAYVGVISIKDMPNATHPGIFDILMAVEGEITISQCFRIVARDEAETYISKKQKEHLAGSKPLTALLKETLTGEESSNVNRGKLALAEDAAQALIEVTGEGRSYGYYNLTVLAYGSSSAECRGTLSEVSKMLRFKGYLLINETLHSLSAWAGTIPGQWTQIVRWYFLSGSNLADMAPVRTLKIGDTTNGPLSIQARKTMPALTVFPTELATPFFFNFHQTDLAHTMVVGPSRMGKSALMNFLISQFRKYSPCNVFIFDKDASCRIPTIIQGGKHINIASEAGSDVSLNPISLIVHPEHREWVKNWVETLICMRGYSLTTEDDKTLWDAIEQLAASFSKEMITLTGLSNMLPRNLSEKLLPWIGSGPYARYFDNHVDNFTLSDFVCMETNGLFENNVVARAFLDYAFKRIDIQLKHGYPSIIYLEEAWAFLEDEKFLAKLNDWLRTLAKKNAFVVLTTQSLAELAGSKIFGTLIDNIPNRIFLPNDQAFAHSAMYKEKFGLNQEQISRIQSARPKLMYYMVSPKLSRMVLCRIPPKVLAVVRSDAVAQKLFDKHMATSETNADWKWNYIEEMAA